MTASPPSAPHPGAADTPAPTPPTSTDAPPPIPRKTKLIRWWGILLLVVPLLLAVIGAEIGFRSLVRGGISSALTGEDLLMDEGTKVSASLLRSRVALDDLLVIDQRNPQGNPPYRSRELRLDVNLLASLGGESWVINRLASDGTRLSFRRRSDGTVPGIDIPPSSEPWDLVSIIGVLHAWWDRYQRYGWIGEHLPRPSAKPEAKPSPEWRSAVYYAPPEAAAAQRRVVVRELLMRGDGIALPEAIGDEVAGTAAMDFTAFVIEGNNVSNRPLADEPMSLRAQLTSAAAGELTIHFEHLGSHGASTLNWRQLPLQLLAQPKVSAGLLQAYGPSGSMDLGIDAHWDANQQLSGAITITLRNLQLHPSDGAGREAREVARQLRQLAVSPILWELPLSGTLSEPRVENLSLSGLTQAIFDSAGDAARELIKQRLREELDGLSAEARERLGEHLGDIDLENLSAEGIGELVNELSSEEIESLRQELSEQAEAGQEALQERARELAQDRLRRRQNQEAASEQEDRVTEDPASESQTPPAEEEPSSPLPRSLRDRINR
ncbi:MAG: hypothetical protein EA402_09810 [Planctomycetota bacterium]|nr:MAG: hypothetical protein EA402_09810 [Planctomycetota bacterium]